MLKTSLSGDGAHRGNPLSAESVLGENQIKSMVVLMQ